MLYDVIGSYKAYLENRYSFETAKTYLKRLEVLLQGQNLNFKAENIDIPKILDSLSNIKYKSYFSQSKNAFLHFCSFLNIVLSDDYLKQINDIEKDTKKKYRKLKVLNFNEVDKKIKSLKNQKLKLSYQTMLATGLRVSELASVNKPPVIKVP